MTPAGIAWLGVSWRWLTEKNGELVLVLARGTEDALHSRTESLSTKALLQAAWAFLLHGGWLLRMSIREPDRRCTALDAQVLNLTWCHFRPSLKLPKAKEREYRAICEWESLRLHHNMVGFLFSFSWNKAHSLAWGKKRYLPIYFIRERYV